METAKETATRGRAAARIGMGGLFAFFIPLGLSSSLVIISHSIINSTLARSPQPEVVIASYALAMSLIGIIERPAVLLRQTCSTLVRDRVSFRAMSQVTVAVLLAILAVGMIIGYTPVGHWIFTWLFGVNESQLSAILDVYRILMFVSVFSGIRCLFQGIIIFNKRTAWMTVGMVVRLIAMYAVAQYYIQTNQVNSGTVGAVIFLIGMAIESIVAFTEGWSLVKRKVPKKLPDHPVERPGQIFRFYRPLIYSSFIAVSVGPAINAFLGKTDNMETAIAAYAIAFNLAQLVQSFFSYLHQIVINFYKTERRLVFKFTMLVAFIPAMLIGLLSYTPLGPWVLTNLIGVNEPLMRATLETLRVFMIMSFIFPWLDFCNGIVMLRGQTRIMVGSQMANLGVTLVMLVALTLAVPSWNGVIGALAQSLGIAAEFAVVLYVLSVTAKRTEKLPGQV